MIKCWDEQPQNRPSFTELRSKFDGMLTADNQDNSYIDFHCIDPTNLCYLPPQMLETAGEAHTSMLSLKSGHHDDGITRSATSLKEMLSKSETNIHFQSPGHKLYSSQSADQMQQAKQASPAVSTSDDQLLNVNRGRPVSMYISSDEAKKERENPYVDEPSSFKSEASNSMLQSSTSPQRLGTKETMEMKHLSVNAYVESHSSNRDLECPEIKISPSEDKN